MNDELEFWNFWVWNAFNMRLYRNSITNLNVVDGEIEFYEGVFEITDNQLIEKIIPEAYREVIKVKHNNGKYVLPIQYAEKMPLIPTSQFKCLLKKSDNKVWNFITGVKSLSISGEQYHKSFKEYINDFNPLKHSNEDTWTLLKLIAFASQYKGVKLCISSNPNAGKNANFTIYNKILNNVGRYGTPTLAVFERSLFFNQTTIIDEITSMIPSQLRELEPIILAISDNSPDYTKHSLTASNTLLNINLSNKSLIFPYNTLKDVRENGGKFFDEVWNNIRAFKSRFPQLYFEGEVLSSFKNYNQIEAKEIMEQHFDEMRKVAKETVFWIQHLHKKLHFYRINHKFTNRHLTNIQGLLDVIDVYSETEQEFNYWLDLLVDSIKQYKIKNRITPENPLELYDNEEVIEEQIEVD